MANETIWDEQTARAMPVDDRSQLDAPPPELPWWVPSVKLQYEGDGFSVGVTADRDAARKKWAAEQKAKGNAEDRAFKRQKMAFETEKFGQEKTEWESSFESKKRRTLAEARKAEADATLAEADAQSKPQAEARKTTQAAAEEDARIRFAELQGFAAMASLPGPIVTDNPDETTERWGLKGMFVMDDGRIAGLDTKTKEPRILDVAAETAKMAAWINPKEWSLPKKEEKVVPDKAELGIAFEELGKYYNLETKTKDNPGGITAAKRGAVEAGLQKQMDFKTLGRLGLAPLVDDKGLQDAQAAVADATAKLEEVKAGSFWTSAKTEKRRTTAAEEALTAAQKKLEGLQSMAAEDISRFHYVPGQGIVEIPKAQPAAQAQAAGGGLQGAAMSQASQQPAQAGGGGLRQGVAAAPITPAAQPPAQTQSPLAAAAQAPAAAGALAQRYQVSLPIAAFSKQAQAGIAGTDANRDGRLTNKEVSEALAAAQTIMSMTRQERDAERIPIESALQAEAFLREYHTLTREQARTALRGRE